MSTALITGEARSIHLRAASPKQIKHSNSVWICITVWAYFVMTPAGSWRHSMQFWDAELISGSGSSWDTFYWDSSTHRQVICTCAEKVGRIGPLSVCFAPARLFEVLCCFFLRVNSWSWEHWTYCARGGYNSLLYSREMDSNGIADKQCKCWMKTETELCCNYINMIPKWIWKFSLRAAQTCSLLNLHALVSFSHAQLNTKHDLSRASCEMFHFTVDTNNGEGKQTENEPVVYLVLYLICTLRLKILSQTAHFFSVSYFCACDKRMNGWCSVNWVSGHNMAATPLPTLYCHLLGVFLHLTSVLQFWSNIITY